MTDDQEEALAAVRERFKRMVEQMNAPGALDRILAAPPEHGEEVTLGPPLGPVRMEGEE